MHVELVPGTSFRQLTSQRTRLSEHVISSSIAGPSVLRASPRLSGSNLVQRGVLWILAVWFRCSSRCRWDHSRRSQPVVNRCSRTVVSIARRAADSSLLCDPQRQP